MTAHSQTAMDKLGFDSMKEVWYGTNVAVYMRRSRVIMFQNILKRLSGIRIRNIGLISSTRSTPTLRHAPKRVMFSARS